MTDVSSLDSSTGDTLSQRDRILEITLKLMSAHGAQAMSMRRLADACGLNVATIYHYFPSKAELLRQVIAQRSYEERLLTERPPVDLDAPPAERLGQLVAWIWEEMNDQDDVWRLLLGESLRGDTEAMASALSLSATFEDALIRWLGEFLADLPGERVATARTLRGLLYGFYIENLPLSRAERSGILSRRATEVASVLARS